MPIIIILYLQDNAGELGHLQGNFQGLHIQIYNSENC